MSLVADRANYVTDAIKKACQRGEYEVDHRTPSPDAIVVGAGPTGCLAAKRLTEAGLNVLLLDAGRPNRTWVRRAIWSLTKKFAGPRVAGFIGRRRQPIQSHCFAWWDAPDTFVDDANNPYATAPHQPFIWLRSRQLGGRIAVPGHGRQYYRLGPSDFQPSDGQTPSWPFSYEELAPWYSSVEEQIGLAGRYDHLSYLPDSRLARVLEYSEAEARLRSDIVARWPNVSPVLGRFGFFDVLDAAARTGRLTIRTGAIVTGVEVANSGRVSAVRWIDERSRAHSKAESRITFLCASAFESTRILMLSTKPSGADAIGSESGVLGRFVMDHIRVTASGYGAPIAETPAEPGRCLYVPRFDGRDTIEPPAGRGFGVQIGLNYAGANRSLLSMVSFGEMLPRPENRLVLCPDRKDAWGIPIISFDVKHGPADRLQAQRQMIALQELTEAAGAKLIHIDKAPATPGSANHECGTARMGADPRDSVLDPHNQCWEAKGLYVTDGACMPSQGAQNPVLTLLAVTARACNHATSGVRKSTEIELLSTRPGDEPKFVGAAPP